MSSGRPKSIHLLGIGLRDNAWDQLEIQSSIVTGEGAALDGFQIIQGRTVFSCRNCGDAIDVGRKFCDTCLFLKHHADDRYRELRMAVREEFRQRRLALSEIGAHARHMARRTINLTNKIYLFINYRLTHRPHEFYRGANSPRAKLTAAAVLDIRQNYAPIPGRSTYSFAQKYGVSQATIYQVVSGSTWQIPELTDTPHVFSQNS